jgi:hypothetical protein
MQTNDGLQETSEGVTRTKTSHVRGKCLSPLYENM